MINKNISAEKPLNLDEQVTCRENAAYTAVPQIMRKVNEVQCTDFRSRLPNATLGFGRYRTVISFGHSRKSFAQRIGLLTVQSGKRRADN